jgi:TadE-like protein
MRIRLWRAGKAGTLDRSSRGQSLVEFALVLPLLLVLLLGVADFGRVFAAGITVEAVARNAAEAGAVERLPGRNPPPKDPSMWNSYYASLHENVAKVACSESRQLPNTSFTESDRTCPTMPVIRVCVHDDQDPICGAPIDGFANPIPSECTQMGNTWSNASAGSDGSHSVEVRVCYQFTTLFNLHLSLPMNAKLNLGDIWLQRERYFVVDCPPGDVSTC